MGRSGDPQSAFNTLDEPSAADRRFFLLPIIMTCHPEDIFKFFCTPAINDKRMTDILYYNIL
jgi:hypothetical protein